MPKDEEVEPRARVFISCGQNKASDELSVAVSIRERLHGLDFDPYIAVQEQSLRGLKENIFERLRESEYFVFVDFKRERLCGFPRDSILAWCFGPWKFRNLLHRGSLFSHQELAIASYLDMPVVAFQEEGVKRDDGIIGFIQANATQFRDRSVLPDLVVKEVQLQSWNPHWRNELILERDPAQRSDTRLTNIGRDAVFFHINVRNRHQRKAATNCYVYLEKAISVASGVEIPFKAAELGWAGYSQPSARVPPQKVRPFDAFYILRQAPTLLQFSTFATATDFVPRIEAAGQYELVYLVVSDNFPITRASFTLSLDASLDRTTLV
ncbi:MAG: hypothetical protein WB579_19955 [Bryobacteraceae bacterium]